MHKFVIQQKRFLVIYDLILYQYRTVIMSADSFYQSSYLSALSSCFRKLDDEQYMDDSQWRFAIIEEMKNRLKGDGIIIVISLHANRMLERYLKFIFKLISDINTNEEIKLDLIYIMRMIYYTGINHFLLEIKDYDKFFEPILKSQHLLKIENTKDYDLARTSQRSVLIVNLLKKIWQIRLIKEGFDLRNELNRFIIAELLVERPQNVYQQSCFNWIKTKVEFIQNENPINLCCRIHFQHATTSKTGAYGESNNQQFKDYHWPLQNDSIKFHLTKTVVGFLNTTGGIIFVGMKENKEKIVEVKGIRFTPEEKIDFLYFLHDDILRGVYPKQAQQTQWKSEQEFDYLIVDIKKANKEELVKNQREKKKNYEYRINKYVSVDFLDVFQVKTFTNYKHEGADTYIARIKIKTGDPRELYHVINDKNVPEAYIREDKSVKKKSMAEFYKFFYERIRIQGDNIAGKDNTHANCRFRPTVF